MGEGGVRKREKTMKKSLGLIKGRRRIGGKTEAFRGRKILELWAENKQGRKKN